MKLSLAILLLSFRCYAGELVISWTIVDDSAVSCRVYYGVASHVYTNFVQVGLTNHATISGLQSGIQYFFALTDLNSNGVESDYSVEISTAIPVPPIPSITDATIYFGPFTILSSADMQTWSTNIVPGFFTTPVGASNQFFRVTLPDGTGVPVNITPSP